MQGAGFVKVQPIPAAPIGTSGTITVRDDEAGAMASCTWQWHPRSQGAAPVRSAAKSQGLLSRLFRRRSGQARIRPKATALTVAQRLGARAASASKLRFFGQEAVGQRFAFVIDISGSMAGPRWNACRKQLEEALLALPLSAEFFVVLFSDTAYEPPEQDGWATAGGKRVKDVIKWIDRINPSGGTFPATAFSVVFRLNERPDVIYFLTDGEIGGFTPDILAELRGSAPTIVNTIALESQASAEALEAIAVESGGTFIHITDASTM